MSRASYPPDRGERNSFPARSSGKVGSKPFAGFAIPPGVRGHTGGRAMSELGKGGWATALAEVERAVGDCLSALDRYEGAFADVLADADPPVRLHRPALEPDGDWADRTDAARRQVHDLEQLLDDQERAWATWQQSYSAWRRSLEQLPR